MYHYLEVSHLSKFYFISYRIILEQYYTCLRTITILNNDARYDIIFTDNVSAEDGLTPKPDEHSHTSRTVDLSGLLSAQALGK